MPRGRCGWKAAQAELRPGQSSATSQLRQPRQNSTSLVPASSPVSWDPSPALFGFTEGTSMCRVRFKLPRKPREPELGRQPGPCCGGGGARGASSPPTPTCTRRTADESGTHVGSRGLGDTARGHLGRTQCPRVSLQQLRGGHSNTRTVKAGGERGTET